MTLYSLICFLFPLTKVFLRLTTNDEGHDGCNDDDQVDVKQTRPIVGQGIALFFNL